MKSIKDFRRSAYFVDVLLLIAAVIAIVGLATFVRLHTTKTPDEVGAKSSLAQVPQHMDTLGVDSGNTTNPAQGVSDPKTSQETNNQTVPGLQSAAAMPESEADDAAHCGTSCNITGTIEQVVPDELPIVTIEPPYTPPIIKKGCGDPRLRLLSTNSDNSSSIMWPL